jgi:protein-S-isoprenylcysteine O-methyltransferase Ste14
MDEMQNDLEGLISVIMAMLLVAAIVLLVVAFWLGQRRVRRGELRRALWTLNALVVINAWLVLMAFWENAKFEDNPAQWLIGGFAGPLVLGYALGASVGLLRTRGSGE